MKRTKVPKGTKKTTLLINLLAKKGYRLFTVSDAKKLIEQESIDIKDLPSALSTLKSQGWIYTIRRNLYALSLRLLAGQPIHEYEIATHLAKPSAISHFSAFQIHQLTDQIPHMVFATVPRGTSIPRAVGKLYSYRGVQYRFIQIEEKHFFGIESYRLGATSIPITDLERTLLDGLMKPHYCGGFMEVMHAFSQKTFDLEKIITYTLKLDKAAAKRLGWVLEKIGYPEKDLKILENVQQKGYIKLVSSLKKNGPYNNRWQVQENL